MKKTLLFISLLVAQLGFSQLWLSQPTNFAAASRGLDEIRIVNSSVVWATAYDGSGGGANVQEFTLTTNGGDTWTPGTIDVGDTALGINNISPVSGTTAWVCAINGDTGTGSCIYKTDDAGLSWTQQNTAGFQNSTSFINYVHFFDENVGIAAGDPIGSPAKMEIWRTTNGGASWTLITGSAVPNAQSGEWGYNGGNVAVGNTVWLVTNKGRIYKSSDQGLTWTATQTPLTDFSGTSQSGRMAFSDANNGCILKTVSGTTPTYTLYTTSNGGTTWSAGTTFAGQHRILSYIPGTTILVGTSQAAPVGSSYSTNNGTTWVDIDADSQKGVSDFLDGSTGWCAGFSSATEGIYKFFGNLEITDFSGSKHIKAFPNPANSNFTLAVEGVDNYNVKMTDMSGKVVYNQQLSGLENTVDVSKLATGAYFITVSGDNVAETIKILKN